MKFLPLILKNLFRRKIRTGLTILSIAVAIFLFGLPLNTGLLAASLTGIMVGMLVEGRS